MRETPSPIDLDEPFAITPGLGWTSAVIATASVVLLAINAVSLADWIDDLPPSPVQAQASAAAARWVEVSEAIGIGVPRRWLHERWKAIEGATF